MTSVFRYGSADSGDRPFAIGQRVETHPATDAWIRGDRYGVVLGYSGRRVRVHLDRSNTPRLFHTDNLQPIND